MSVRCGLDDIACWICSFYPSCPSYRTVSADPFLRYTLRDVGTVRNIDTHKKKNRKKNILLASLSPTIPTPSSFLPPPSLPTPSSSLKLPFYTPALCQGQTTSGFDAARHVTGDRYHAFPAPTALVYAGRRPRHDSSVRGPWCCDLNCSKERLTHCLGGPVVRCLFREWETRGSVPVFLTEVIPVTQKLLLVLLYLPRCLTLEGQC